MVSPFGWPTETCPVTYVLWYASLSSITLLPLSNGKRKRGMMWREGLSHSSWGEHSLEKQLKSKGSKSNLGQVPCSQDKPTLRLQVITGRKILLLPCTIGLCWPCLAACFDSLESPNQTQPDVSCLFLYQFSTSAHYCSLCSLCSPFSSSFTFPE